MTLPGLFCKDHKITIALYNRFHRLNTLPGSLTSLLRELPAGRLQDRLVSAVSFCEAAELAVSGTGQTEIIATRWILFEAYREVFLVAITRQRKVLKV